MWFGESPKDSFPKRQRRYLGLHSHLQLARRHIGNFKKKSNSSKLNSKHQDMSVKCSISLMNLYIFYKMGTLLMISIFLLSLAHTQIYNWELIS